MLSPIACLWFFLSTSAQLNYAFLSQLYYYQGNIAFTMVFTLIIGSVSDLPVQMVRQMPYTLILTKLDPAVVQERISKVQLYYGMNSRMTDFSRATESRDMSAVQTSLLEEDAYADTKGGKPVDIDDDDSNRDTTMVSEQIRGTNMDRATYNRDGNSMFGRFTTFKNN